MTSSVLRKSGGSNGIGGEIHQNSSNGGANGADSPKAANHASAESQQGWCPVCLLHSVFVTSTELICSSPECRWTAERDTTLEKEVMSGPPEMTSDRLRQLRQEYGLSAV